MQESVRLVRLKGDGAARCWDGSGRIIQAEIKSLRGSGMGTPTEANARAGGPMRASRARLLPMLASQESDPETLRVQRRC